MSVTYYLLIWIFPLLDLDLDDHHLYYFVGFDFDVDDFVNETADSKC